MDLNFNNALNNVYKKHVTPNLNANHSSQQSSNIPIGAAAAKNYREDQEEVTGHIVNFNKDNIEDSEIQVSGFGTWTIKTLRSYLESKLEQAISSGRSNNKNYFYHLYKHDLIKHIAKALSDSEDQIEKRRLAGKLPGLKKRIA